MPKTDIKTYTLRLTDSEAKELERIRQTINESTTAGTFKHLISYYRSDKKAREKQLQKIAELEKSNFDKHKKLSNLRQSFRELLE